MYVPTSDFQSKRVSARVCFYYLQKRLLKSKMRKKTYIEKRVSFSFVPELEYGAFITLLSLLLNTVKIFVKLIKR